MDTSPNSSFTTSEGESICQPPSIIYPHLLDSIQTTTREISNTTPLTPEQLEQQRLLFIKQFQETIEKTTQQLSAQHHLSHHHNNDSEVIYKLLAESESEVRPLPQTPLHTSSSTNNRLSFRSSDRRSPKLEVRVKSLERMSETTSNSNPNNANHLSSSIQPPPPSARLSAKSNNSSNKRVVGTPMPHPKTMISPKKTGNLLKDSFYHMQSETKQITQAEYSYHANNNGQHVAAETFTVSEVVTSEILNEEYDSDYWEDERLLLKWQARRAGMTYFGIEELEKHKEQTRISSEEKMKLLMR